MEDLKLYTAKVIDIKDTDKQGKIKVRILPLFDKIDDKDLPWAIPFGLELSSNTMSNDLPRIDSTIRVLCDKYWKKFYWLPNRYFYGLFDYGKVENKLSKGKDSEGGSVDTTYENIKFRLYDDGGLEFHNNKDGSHGFIHKSGSYALFDKNGGLSTNTNLSKIDIRNSIVSLGNILSTLMEDLANLHTEGSPTNHTSPTLTLQMQTLKMQLEQLFNVE